MSMRSRMHTWRFAFIAMVAAGWISLAWAQGSEGPAAGVEDRVTLWGLWKTGGAFMYPIAFLSIAGVALTVYGFLTSREKKMLQMELVPTLQDSISRLDFRNAASICTGSPGVMTNILHSGLGRLEDDYHDMGQVEKAMEEAATEESAAGLKPISYLSIIASIAPMFGLLGTVSGMIKAFQKIGLGGMGDPERLAADIGEAMVTTAFGLLVGIPMMFFYFYLKSKFQAHMARIGRILGNLTHQLGQIFRRIESGEITVEAVQKETAVPAGAEG